MPRLTNEGGDGSTGAASSSSGTQGALALTTSSGGIPNGEMGPSPSTLFTWAWDRASFTTLWSTCKWHAEFGGEPIDTTFSFWLFGGSAYPTISAADR